MTLPPAPRQNLLGEVRESGPVPCPESPVGDETALREGEDLDDAWLGGGCDDGLQPLGAHHGARQTYALYPGYEVPEARGGLKRGRPREPLPLPYQRRQVLLAALAAQQRDHLVHDQAAIVVFPHPDTRGAAAHLAVEADAALSGASLEGEDPAQRLYARVEHAGAAVRPEVNGTVLALALRHPFRDRIRLAQIELYEPAAAIIAARGVVAGEQALYLPGLEDEGVQLALRLPHAHLGDLLDETADLAPPVAAVEVRANPRSQVLGLTDVQGNAVLVNKVVDAGRAGDVLGEALLLWFDAPPRPTTQRSRLPHAPHPGGAQQLEEFQEHPGGRRRVGEGAVVRHRPHAEVGGERGETVAPEARHQTACELEGIEDRVRERQPAGGRHEGAVEVDVVPDEDRALDKPLERGHDLGDRRRLGDHAVRDAGQAGDEGLYLAPRVDKRGELLDYLPAHHLQGAYLRDRTSLRRGRTRGLDVEDYVGGLLQREREWVGNS